MSSRELRNKSKAGNSGAQKRRFVEEDDQYDHEATQAKSVRSLEGLTGTPAERFDLRPLPIPSVRTNDHVSAPSFEADEHGSTLFPEDNTFGFDQRLTEELGSFDYDPSGDGDHLPESDVDEPAKKRAKRTKRTPQKSQRRVSSIDNQLQATNSSIPESAIAKNIYNILPPLGMARDLHQANDWARDYNLVMNGLVVVPEQVEDEDKKILPATNNGWANPYTAVKSAYRKDWTGEGAHLNQKNAEKNARNPQSSSKKDRLAFPMNKFEILRVLGIGPYYGYCLPMIDLGGLCEYHRLVPNSPLQNQLTSEVKKTFQKYYLTGLQQSHLPYYYSSAGDASKKPQAPQGTMSVVLGSGPKIALSVFDKRDMALYDAWAQQRDGLRSQHPRTQVRHLPCMSGYAAALAVRELEGKEVPVPVHAHPHATSLLDAYQRIKDGSLVWRDWSNGHCIDTHWVWHQGNQAEKDFWEGVTHLYSHAQNAILPVNAGVIAKAVNVMCFRGDLYESDFDVNGQLITKSGPKPILHTGHRLPDPAQ